jgi:hypothetical protein
MFGWSKKNSPSGDANPIAAASARRRASQGKTCEDDVRALLRHAFDLAVFVLEGGQIPTFVALRNGFAPFGVGLGRTGEIVDFNCLWIPDQPGKARVFVLPDQLMLFSPASAKPRTSVQLLEQLEERAGRAGSVTATSPDYVPPPVEALAHGMKSFAADGMIRAAALVDRVELQAADAGEPEYSLRIQVEHVEMEPTTRSVPYRLENKRVVRGEPVTTSGRSIVFAK